jgi:mannose-6-phosphate isomerase-like protein (cupin superfamily)
MADPSPFVIHEDDRDPLDLPYHHNMSARELVNPELGSDHAVFRITEIDPGKRTVDEWHSHESAQQLVYALEGEGTLVMSETGSEADSEFYDLPPGTFAFIPPTVYHDIWNEGETPFKMIIVWAPPYDSYEEWNPDTDGE